VLVRDDTGGLTRGWGEVGRDPAMWMDKDPVIWRFRMDYVQTGVRTVVPVVYSLEVSPFSDKSHI
jgi:hypothetical protein